MRECADCHPSSTGQGTDSAIQEAQPMPVGGVPLCCSQGDTVLMTVLKDSVTPDRNSETTYSHLPLSLNN